MAAGFEPEGPFLKRCRRRFYVSAINRLGPILQSAGLLAGPRLWIPVEIEGRVVRAPLMGGIGLELKPLKYSWKTFVVQKLAVMRPGSFVDVGVHLGETLIDVRFAHPKLPYMGFEPNSECLHYVSALIRMNRFPACSIVGCGLSERAGLFKFYRRALTDSGASLREDLRPALDHDVLHVPVFRFDEIRASLGVDGVGFAKIDVEGAELEVLQGMKKTMSADRPVIMCEVLFTDESASLEAAKQRNEELLNLLRESGYEIWLLHKSPQGRIVSAIEPVQAFESAFWTRSNAELCDYLFLPQEHVYSALRALEMPVKSQGRKTKST